MKTSIPREAYKPSTKKKEKKLKFEVDKSLFPFKNNFLELSNEINVHYIDEGKGPVILLLHGNPTWSFLYRKMITELKVQFG